MYVYDNHICVSNAEENLMIDYSVVATFEQECILSKWSKVGSCKIGISKWGWGYIRIELQGAQHDCFN
jgi:hypothetical protein